MLVAGRQTLKFFIPGQTTGVSALSLISVIGAITKCFRGNRGTLLDVCMLIHRWGKVLSNTKHLVGGNRVLKLGPCKWICFISQHLLSVLAQNIN